jgi:predicted ester cyclase
LPTRLKVKPARKATSRAATGKQIVVAGTVITRIDAGKFQEDWETIDMLGLMQQLGAIPEFA